MPIRHRLPKSATAIAAAIVLSGAVGSLAMAGDSAVDTDRQAASEAQHADQDLRHAHAASAVAHAERAVRLRPQVAAYRLLLGQSYLKAGRFASARDAFGDALALEPTNGRAALNLALSQVAIGDWEHARQTLTAGTGTIAPADRGLALALAGDPVAGVEVLTAAARAPGADVKTRQNLALALALAGRWQEARAVVGIDLSPDQVDARIVQWAAFAQPHSASDQVATLLGVRAVEDSGQPAALALSSTAPQLAAQPQAAPAADPIDAYMPGQPGGAVATQEVPAAAPEPVEQPAPVAVAEAAAVQFGPRQEVVQPLPVASPAPVRVAAQRPARPASTTPTSGNYYVQVGAYQNAAVARDAWQRIRSASATLGAYRPQGMSIRSARGSFYRLSVGGFSRDDAAALCASYRQSGGRCFVRAGAGDRIAAWAGGQRIVALASR